MQVWEFINEKLFDGIKIMLVYVLESTGSSPGRQGFKMAIAADGELCGTIGGGIMEHKFVEKAKSLLQHNETSVLLEKQFHDKGHVKNRSGMICSGNQVNVFVPLGTANKKTVINIFTSREKIIHLSPAGLGLIKGKAKGFQYSSDEEWVYTEGIDQRPVIHIIGGGHISLALSELLAFLGFFIKVYEDRPALKTLFQNSFADEKIIIPGYEQLNDFFTGGENDYVVIMTVGYRTDKTVLKQILGKDFFYLGLLGSGHKIEILFNELKEEGVDEKLFKKLYSPIGLGIHSKTTKEIAVSIAAEIIQKKNNAI